MNGSRIVKLALLGMVVLGGMETALAGCFFDWRNALHVVKPDTFICWHGQSPAC